MICHLLFISALFDRSSNVQLTIRPRMMPKLVTDTQETSESVSESFSSPMHAAFLRVRQDLVPKDGRHTYGLGLGACARDEKRDIDLLIFCLLQALA